jgi:hypothetical protein
VRRQAGRAARQWSGIGAVWAVPDRPGSGRGRDPGWGRAREARRRVAEGVEHQPDVHRWPGTAQSPQRHEPVACPLRRQDGRATHPRLRRWRTPIKAQSTRWAEQVTAASTAAIRVAAPPSRGRR